MTLDAWLVTLGALGAAVVLGSQALRHIPLTGPLLALGAWVRRWARRDWQSSASRTDTRC